MFTFDKDKAREEVLRNYPQAHPLNHKGREPINITPELLDKIIRLYPTTRTRVMEEILGISVPTINSITRILRDMGKLPEREKVKTMEERVKEALAKLENR